MKKTLLTTALLAVMAASQQQQRKPLTRCAAHRDGECHHQDCPQLRDGEPAKTGRHCQLDTYTDED